MGNFIFGFTQQTGTFTAGQNINTSHGAASRVEDLSRPRRTVRSTDLVTDMHIDLDLGSALSIEGYSVENCNASQVTVITDDNSDYSSPTDSTVLPIAVDPAGGRRKGYLARPSATAARYVRLLVDKDDVLAGETYLEVGAFGLWLAPTTLSANVAVPYDKDIESRTPILELEGGGQEVGLDSPITVRLGMTIRYKGGDAVETEVQALSRAARHTVGFIYENNGNTAEVYHVRRSGDFQFRRGDGAIEDVSGMDFLEVA